MSDPVGVETNCIYFFFFLSFFLWDMIIPHCIIPDKKYIDLSILFIFDCKDKSLQYFATIYGDDMLLHT